MISRRQTDLTEAGLAARTLQSAEVYGRGRPDWRKHGHKTAECHRGVHMGGKAQNDTCTETPISRRPDTKCTFILAELAEPPDLEVARNVLF
jgi:hypothetical protein